MNVQYVTPEFDADTQERINQLQIAASSMSQDEINIALGMKPMERKLSTKAKIGLGASTAVGVAGLLAVGCLAENKLSVVGKIGSGVSSLVSFFTGGRAEATPV